MPTPKFDIILLGATGYTGVITAEHIATNFPTSLKWAIAGRSPSGLGVLASKLEALNPDRSPPIIIRTELEKEALHTLVKRTRVLINAVGPYHRYSEPVVEACANEGVNYLDFSTETLWIAEMIAKYHETAKKNDAIMIHGASNSSSPPDLLSWLIASKIHEKTSKPAKSIVVSGKLDMVDMGGGSVNTVLSVAEHYGIGFLLNPDPLSLVPIKDRPREKWNDRWTWGFEKHAELGTLMPSLTGISNTAIVQRSAYLNPELYNTDFTYTEYMPAPNAFASMLITLFTKFAVLLLAFSLVRKIIKKITFKPGQGPDWRENGKKESVSMNAVGQGENGTRVRGRFEWKGAVVHVSAILVAEAAGVLLEMDNRGETKGSGGMQTPSFLGEGLVERLRTAGCVFDVEA